MEDFEQVPYCPHCGRRMQFNKMASSMTVHQYLCGCRGIVFHKNIIIPQKKDTNVVIFKKG